MRSPRKEAGLQQVVFSSRFESCESRRDFRTSRGFLSAHTEKVECCRGGEKVTGSFGEGSCGCDTRHCQEGLLADALAGTTLTSAFP